VALPAVSGTRDDFGSYLRLVTGSDPARTGEPLARSLDRS
jgi:hypothetical protein